MKTQPPTKILTTGDTLFYRFDPVVGFWGVPNIERRIAFEYNPEVPVVIRHNEYGNRDYPFDPSKEEDTIVCFGGSHSWGAGVELEECYTSQLAQQIGHRVVNLGHCSLGLDQICVTMLEKSKFYNPATIIVEQYPWALHRILNTYVNGYVKPYFSVDAKNNLKLNRVPQIVRSPLFRRITGSFHAYRKDLREFKAGIDLSNNYDPTSDPVYLYWKLQSYASMYTLADKILKVMHDFCYQNNIKLLFALGAVRQQFGPASKSALVDYELPKKRLIELLDRNYIPYVDTTKTLLAEHSEQAPTIFYDGHINAKGHSIFAKLIQKGLEERGWIRP